MALSKPREGSSLEFHLYPTVMNEGTLGDPESLVWSSIRHLCSWGVVEEIAKIHRIAKKKDRMAAGRNLKLYIRQPSAFYDAARSAKPNTAPLIYYYSFLNLAKALCELRMPGFHQHSECYKHGMSWTPSRQNYADPETEMVSITTRGVWHVLWEAMTGLPCPAPNPTRVRIKHLLSYCPEVSVESEQAFGTALNLIDMKNPDVLYDAKASEAWIRFSVPRTDLKELRVSGPSLKAQLDSAGPNYPEVNPTGPDLRTYQSTPKKLRRGEHPYEGLRTDISALNGFAYPGRKKQLEYFLPVQRNLPFAFPQLVVNYTILFWLGSLVRYDPHSVAALMDSGYWMLIDGFMSQSRLWLLELFEWALYRAETTLWVSR